MGDTQRPEADERVHAQAPAEGPDAAAPETQPTGKDERHHSEEQVEGTEEAAQS